LSFNWPFQYLVWNIPFTSHRKHTTSLLPRTIS
jgi:hypothetical protein